MTWREFPGDAIVSDAAFDTVRRAIDAVFAEYREAHKRAPTKTELEHILTFAVDREELGVVKGVMIDLAAYDPDDDDDD